MQLITQLRMLNKTLTNKN